MSKNLSELSLEELWELFPIYLTEHQSKWNQWFEEEAELLYKVLDKRNMRISHIGSTAINNIWAKPIIDILAEITSDQNINSINELFTSMGYTVMSESENRISLNKGYTSKGYADKVFHLHIRYLGDNDELYFRDYLNEHPKLAKQYEDMKLKLWKQYEHDRDGYTNAKTEFISECTEMAKKEYPERYKFISN